MGAGVWMGGWAVRQASGGGGEGGAHTSRDVQQRLGREPSPQDHAAGLEMGSLGSFGPQLLQRRFASLPPNDALEDEDEARTV